MQSKREVRLELERDLKPFDITDDEIDALLEWLGYKPKKGMLILNTGKIRSQTADEKQR